MSADLIVDIEKEFATGVNIQAQFRLPTDRFSVLILFGPSGCGKTTVLRSLAGLERPSSGRITFNNETWFAKDKRIDLSPQRRGIGFCFQDYALFPHLTVANNVAYGPGSATDVLKQFDLEDIRNRYPHQLSGGQQQRVALARSIARRPKLLLLDEPLSALDTMLRESLRVTLRRLLSEYAIPVVLVTHDRTEAISMGDQIVVMDDGRVLQSGSVDQVFGKPRNAAVAKIVGIETVIPGTITDLSDGVATVNTDGTEIFAVPDCEGDSVIGSQVYLCIKGEDVTLQRSVKYAQSSRNHIPAIVTWIIPEGALVRIGLNCGFELTSLITRSAREQLNIQQGDELIALIKASAIHVVNKK